MEEKEDLIIKEILTQCKKKKIRVQFILKVNYDGCKARNMDYFIAPPEEDVGGVCFGGRHGYSYDCKSKAIRKDSIGMGEILPNSEQFIEVYRISDEEKRFR